MINNEENKCTTRVLSTTVYRQALSVCKAWVSIAWLVSRDKMTKK